MSLCSWLEEIMGDERNKPRDWKVTTHRWDNGQFCELIEALKSRGGSDLPVLTAIGEIKEILMGLKEDYEALSARFDTLDEATTLIADDIAALKEEIRIANENSNVDLSGLVTRAENIETRLRGSAGPGPGSDPA